MFIASINSVPFKGYNNENKTQKSNSQLQSENRVLSKVQVDEIKAQADAVNNVVPTLKNVSNYSLKKGDDIIAESKAIQEKATKLYTKILHTANFANYVKNGKFITGKNGYLFVRFGDTLYNVQICPDRIVASEKKYNVSKDKKEKGIEVYEFNPRTNELTSYTKGNRKIGHVVEFDEQFCFENGKLKKCDIGVSNASIKLVKERFEFLLNEKGEEKLFQFSQGLKYEKGIFSATRIFGYDFLGKLKQFTRDYESQSRGIKKAQLLYEFNENEEIERIRKDYTQLPTGAWAAYFFCKNCDKDLSLMYTKYKKTNQISYESGIMISDGKIVNLKG